jgi:K(+)-stimulated pyrophosphate-energized sodium pump
MQYLYLALGAAVAGLIAAGLMAMAVLRKDPGSDRLQEISRLIQEGAMAFLKREYTILAGFVALMAVALAVVVDYNAFGSAKIEELNRIAYTVNNSYGTGPWTAVAYVCGAVCSALTGFIGMSIAVRSNCRTTAAAQKSLNAGLRVAFGAGSVMGLSVVGVGLLGITVMWLVFRDPNIAAGFGLGASSIALFARVGGGIYTKAADVGADLVGKVEAGIPEDDPRNPATIADNVGDNVGDVAGMGADLFESYVGGMVAALSLAAAAALAPDLGLVTGEALAGYRNGAGFDISAALFALPLALSGVGILCSILGTFLVRTGEQASMSKLLWALRYGIFGAGILFLAGTAGVVLALGLPFKLFWVVVTGLVSGQVIATATEYFTSYEYKPVQWIAKQANTGPASVIIGGIAVGMMSTLLPTLAVCGGIWIAYGLAGLYGVALAGVGMLATLGITLATDAYGPVADNAGGLAEQAHLPPEVREKTDALDSLGNTTAATGKGFAIGSAVLTALGLMASYVTAAGIDPDSMSILHVPVMVGLLLGCVLPFLFSSMTMRAVGEAAGAMIEEVRRQFREIPGLREGKEGVKPDAARAVDISTRGALRAMILPGFLAVVSPIAVGVVLGAEALGGMLLGAIATGFLLAVFMANAGGAWDNAKKYIEAGHHGGKRSEAHKAAVSGDTVGDPFKDTSGPAINILIKLMAIVSVIFGPLFL